MRPLNREITASNASQARPPSRTMLALLALGALSPLLVAVLAQAAPVPAKPAVARGLPVPAPRLVPAPGTAHEHRVAHLGPSAGPQAPRAILIDIPGLETRGIQVLEADVPEIELQYDLFGERSHEVHRFAIAPSLPEPGLLVVSQKRGTPPLDTFAPRVVADRDSSGNALGVVTVRSGLCLFGLTLIVPPGSDIYALFNRRAVPGSVRTVDGLLAAFRRAQYVGERSELLATFNTYLSRRPPARMIRMEQVIKLMEQMGGMSAKKVAEAFAGRVIDRQNAARAAELVSPFDRAEAIALLLR